MREAKNRWLIIIVAVVLLTACAGMAFVQNPSPDSSARRGGRRPKRDKPRTQGYSTEQACSDNAQLHTIAFSGLAFMTGTFGADTFLPPGKAADFFGFQYMRDIDASEAGHNMNFLTRIADNILYVLDAEQKALLIDLAGEQEELFQDLATTRFPLIKAFRMNLEGKLPGDSSGLSLTAVRQHVAGIFEIDGRLSYRRAEVFGRIAQSLEPDQIAYIRKLSFNDSSTWPPLPRQLDKKALNHNQNVAVMTYASEFFSWYAG